MRATIAETGMPGVEPVNGWLSVAKFRDDQKLNAEARLLAEEFGVEAEAWSAEQVRDVLKSPLYQNAIHFPRAFHIHPMNYTRGLATAAEQAGVRIFEHTPALSLDPAGVRKRIGTPSARVRAAQIVLAGNTGVGALMPQLAASLLPITTYVATTAPLGEQLKEAITYKGGVSDSLSADSHYRIVDGDRLMWTGGMTMWVGNPRRYAQRLAADIRRAYPQLGCVSVDHVWSGTLGRAVHKMPQIGEIARGVWVASGFGGHGFNTTAMAGDLIARYIVKGDETWRLFSPYDLVWAGGKAGRAAAQALYWVRRARERLDAQFGRPADMRLDAGSLVLAKQTAVPFAAQEKPILQAPAPAAAANAVTPEASEKPGQRRKAAKAKKPNKEAAIADDKAGSSMTVETKPQAPTDRVPVDS